MTNHLREQLVRAEEYLAQAQALALVRTRSPGDEWSLVATALEDSRALLTSGRGRDCPVANTLMPTGRSCAWLIRNALTELRLIPSGPHSLQCADAFRVALVALDLAQSDPVS